MKKLVAFYSRAGENYFGGSKKYVNIGNTEKVGKQIAQMVGADLFKIDQVVPYSENYNTCILEAKYDLENHVRPNLKNTLENMDEYDEIYLGYPNYWGTMPMAVYTFLESHDFKGKKIHPFCTHEGSGLSSTVSDIQNVVSEAQVTKGLAILGSHASDCVNELKGWI